MQRACERYTEIFKDAAAHARRGRLADERRMRCGSRSAWASTTAPTAAARIRTCRSGTPSRSAARNFPTTLPTLDELIGVDGITEDNVAAHLLERTREPAPAGHVFTLHAELEGMQLAPALRAAARRLEGAGLDARPDARAVRDGRADGAAALHDRSGHGAGPHRHAARPGPRVPGRRRPRARCVTRATSIACYDSRESSHDARQESRRLHRALHRRHVQAVRRNGRHPSCSISTRRTTRPAARPRARDFRDLHDEVRKAGRGRRRRARAIRSSRTRASRRRWNFRSSCSPTPTRELCAQFDVIKMKNMYGKQVRGIERSTFVIDRDGQARARMARGQGARPRAGSARPRSRPLV